MFTNLIKLECSNCTNLKDENLSNMLKSNKCLEYLNIQFCPDITTGFIKSAIKETKIRKNNILLTIFIEDIDDFDLDNLEETSPLLEIAEILYK